MSIPIDDKRKYLQKRLDFVNLSKEVNTILSEFNVKLNFLGFTETFQDYIESESSVISVLHQLTIDINQWINYLSQVEAITKYYANHFLILSDSENDVAKSNEYKQKHFILKNYEKSLHTYKKRFINSRRDCIEKTKESYKAFYREY